MAHRLQEEIQQKKPFRNPEAEAFLNLLRTADALARQVDRALKPHGLTLTQYNVLRILRGADAEGATCSYVAERLVTSDPDVTRLLDRIEKSGMIERSRSSRDRRVVLTRLTRAGADLLSKLDHEIDQLHVQQFKGLGRRALRPLVEQLELIRADADQR